MLKKIIVGSILIAVSLYANDIYSDPKEDNNSYLNSKKYDQKINWIDFKTAYNLALDKKNNKDLFIMVGSTTCHFCSIAKQMLRKDKKIITYINKNYLPVYINQDKDFIPVDLMVPGTPSFWITNNKGIPLKEMKIGMRSTEDLFNYIKK